MAVSRKRSANYSNAELDCLLKGLEEDNELVWSKLGGKYKTYTDIAAAWEELAEKVTAIGDGYFGTRRTGREVKKKWFDLKSRVKAKAATLSMEASDAPKPKVSFTAVEQRVFKIISNHFDDTLESKINILSAREIRIPDVKVFSFHHNESSKSEDMPEAYECDENEQSTNMSESDILEEIKISGSANEDKKRRISEAFSSANAEKKLKKIKAPSEEEQLLELCRSQKEINCELHSIKDILKKCQTSIEKIAVLKRAELRLKCAKYGVDFDDLFD